MLQKGIGTRTIRWVQRWLCNRLAFVTINNTCSEKKIFWQGVPQGSVLSPLLFIIYIDDITEGIPEDVTASLFADDVALYSCDEDLEEACHKVQRALDSVSSWSKKWKLTISIDKCESSFFSTSNGDATWRPKLETEGQPVRYTQNSKFLGVTYDPTLNF